MRKFSRQQTGGDRTSNKLSQNFGIQKNINLRAAKESLKFANLVSKLERPRQDHIEARHKS